MPEGLAKTRGQLLVFIHIPKTAGTTFRNLLIRNEPGNLTQALGNVFKGGGGFSTDAIERLRAGKAPEIKGARVITGHLPLGIRKDLKIYVPRDREIRSCTFLREPVDRTLSHYFSIRRGEDTPKDLPPLAESAGLADAVAAGYIHDNLQTRMLSGDPDPFGRVTSRMLKDAKRNLEAELVFFGLTERFDESLVLAKRRLGLNSILAESAARVNDSRPRGAAVPEEIRAAAAECNGYDLELYEYATELFESLPERAELDFAVELAALQSARASGEVDLEIPAPPAFGGSVTEWRLLLHSRATALRVSRALAIAHRRCLADAYMPTPSQAGDSQSVIELNAMNMERLEAQMRSIEAVAGGRAPAAEIADNGGGARKIGKRASRKRPPAKRSGRGGAKAAKRSARRKGRGSATKAAGGDE